MKGSDSIQCTNESKWYEPVVPECRETGLAKCKCNYYLNYFIDITEIKRQTRERERERQRQRQTETDRQRDRQKRETGNEG